MPVRCRAHGCCLDETRRGATLVETQRGNVGHCDRGALHDNSYAFPYDIVWVLTSATTATALQTIYPLFSTHVDTELYRNIDTMQWLLRNAVGNT